MCEGEDQSQESYELRDTEVHCTGYEQSKNPLPTKDIAHLIAGPNCENFRINIRYISLVEI